MAGHQRIAADPGRLYRPPDLRAFLRGDWQLRRVLHDRRRARAGRFAGLACFLDGADGLVQDERGRLRFEGHDGSGERRYRWRFCGPTAAEIRFADGRPFHALDLGAGDCDVRHDCDPDLYLGRFAALSPGLWRLRWRVTGPRKDLEIRSLYRRA